MISRVITIDGPSGTGKGTISRALARGFDWHYLDSGAIYRALGFAAEQDGVEFDDETALATLARSLDLSFDATGDDDVRVLLGNKDISADIRTEEGGARASRVAKWPLVRTALLQRQRDFACEPGLVADGRDMGTVVFPDAPAKVFLTASAEERARRRYRQLLARGIEANILALTASVEERDRRDQERAASPLKPATDAFVLDSTNLTIDEVLAECRAYAESRLDPSSAQV